MVIYPPHREQVNCQNLVFLAGSIEMGRAEAWQDDIASFLEQHNKNLIIANPRRKDWDSSWEQSIDNPHFVEQVHWELDHLSWAGLVVFYFDPNTQSPITLLELGKALETKAHQIIVCCPNGYYRKGNVDIACSRKRVTVVETIDDLKAKILKVL